MKLFLLDMLLFTYIDFYTTKYMLQSFTCLRVTIDCSVILSAVLTFMASVLLRWVREAAGRANLARKTLVDKRLLI